MAPHLESTVEDVLLCSIRNNARDGITGLLICDGVHFAQALEGPRAAVEACFARIATDERHRDVRAREQCDARARDFAQWSMCALSLSPLEDSLLGAADLGFDLRQLSSEALWGHLRGVAARHAAELNARHALIARSLSIPVGTVAARAARRGRRSRDQHDG